MTAKTTATAILPTNNASWGLWGTCLQNGQDAEATWNAASAYFGNRYGLDPVDTRNLLDSRFGRHLADALTFPGETLEKIDAKWGKWVRDSIRAAVENRDSF